MSRYLTSKSNIHSAYPGVFAIHKAKAVATIKVKVDLQNTYNELYRNGFKPCYIGGQKNSESGFVIELQDAIKMTFYGTTVQIAYPYNLKKEPYRTIAKMTKYITSDPALTNTDWKNITWPQEYINEIHALEAKKLKAKTEEEMHRELNPEPEPPLEPWERELKENTTYEIIDTGIKYTFKNRTKPNSDKGLSQTRPYRDKEEDD